ncbi:unnamed protein product [Peniophora sp. CBMAI 1063]|nr:unnamed protein product [Peniophora sp. CBMAI 1063]
MNLNSPFLRRSLPVVGKAAVLAGHQPSAPLTVGAACLRPRSSQERLYADRSAHVVDFRKMDESDGSQESLSDSSFDSQDENEDYGLEDVRNNLQFMRVQPPAPDTRFERLFREDVELLDRLCSYLSPEDLAALSLVNRNVSAEARAYVRRAIAMIGRVLSPFFNNVDGFRTMQAKTGTLVSGSTALQLLDRTTYTNSDLDLYVDHRYAGDVVTYLLEQEGYSFERRGHQDVNAHRALENVVHIQDVYGLPEPVPAMPGYLGRGIRAVLDFTRGDKKIQLITSKKAPLDIILLFHSTCVMNVITHQRAYSLFPRATLIDRVTLAINTAGEGERWDIARQKYANRGWRVVDLGNESLALEESTDFQSMDRWVGDSETWTVPLLPKLPHLEDDFMSINAFRLAYDSQHGAEIGYDLCESPRLKFCYTSLKAERTLLMPIIVSLINRPHSGTDFLDKGLSEGMRLLRDIRLYRPGERVAYSRKHVSFTQASRWYR